MTDYTHKDTGVRVSVADDKVLGSDWAPVEAEKPKPRSKKTNES